MATRAISSSQPRITRFRFVVSVFLPYAAGYFLSYLLRSINAVVAADLTAEFHLRCAEFESLTATYFLTFAVAQVPLSLVLDRIEPGVVQSVLMLVAAVGGLISAEANSFPALLLGRALIGLGTAATLAAALKAIAVWMPQERMPLATGMMVMFGALGALAATSPADLVARHVGWRALFVLLAGLTSLAALTVILAAPEATKRALPQATPGLAAIYRDRRFWRIVPLSALGVGNSWSLQSLWAALWMRDVQGFDETRIVSYFAFMALAVSIAAPMLGLLSVRHYGPNPRSEHLWIGTLSLSALAQLALVLRLSFPPLLLWTMVSVASATTVFGYVLIGSSFDRSLSARANSALNLFNIVGAILLQAMTALVFAQWPNTGGVYPVTAYQIGFSIPLILQLMALLWYLIPSQRHLPSMQFTMTRYRRRLTRNHQNSPPTEGLRFAALASVALCIALASTMR